jgi:hypothetical protein
MDSPIKLVCVRWCRCDAHSACRDCRAAIGLPVHHDCEPLLLAPSSDLVQTTLHILTTYWLFVCCAHLQAKISDIRRWRESEITHGRVAMLAALGFIVGEQLQE